MTHDDDHLAKHQEPTLLNEQDKVLSPSDHSNHEEQTPATHAEMALFLASHISSQLARVTELLEMLCIAHKPQIDEHMPEAEEIETGEDLREYPGDRLPCELTEIAD